MIPTDCLRAANEFSAAYAALLDRDQRRVRVNGQLRAIPQAHVAAGQGAHGGMTIKRFPMRDVYQIAGTAQAAALDVAMHAALTGTAMFFRLPQTTGSCVSDEDKLPCRVVPEPHGRPGAVLEIAVKA